jgi:hypothetical protein
MPGANDGQVGGNHYKQFKTQPWDAIADWRLDYFSGSAVAYLARYQYKGDRMGDLKKALHYIQKLIEIEEARND